MNTSEIIMAPVATKSETTATKSTKSATKSARPVRLNRFEVHEYDIIDEPNVHTIPSDMPIFKSDVHYCAEKFAIDYITHMGQNDVANTKLALYKTAKNDDISAVLVSVIWWDEDTKQVVID